MIQGIDFAYGSGLTTAQVKTAGYQFVCRYLTGLDGNTKDDSAAELAADLAAGLATIFVFETNGMMPGQSKGITDAKGAQAQLDSFAAKLNRPDLKTAPVFFAGDAQNPGDVAGYMTGACSVIGKARAGIYGGLASVKTAFDHGVTTYGWQTYAWSAGMWDNRALLRQVQNGITVGPAQADLDQAGFWGSAKILTVKDDFGQFPAPSAPVPVPVPVPPPGPVPPLPAGWQATIMTRLGTPAQGDPNPYQVDVVQDLVNLALRGAANWVPLAVDGSFGPLTAAGVRHVQSLHSLTVTGQVDPRTWAVLLTGATV